MSAVLTRLKADLVTKIKALNLAAASGATGNVGGNVYGQLTEEILNPGYPCVLVVNESRQGQDEASSFTTDFVTFPVRIWVVDPQPMDYQRAASDYEAWRDSIEEMLRGLVNKPYFATTPEVFDVRVRTQGFASPRQLRERFIRSGLVALCKTARARVGN